MSDAFTTVIEKCRSALESHDPQTSVEAILLDAAKDQAIGGAMSSRVDLSSLEDLAIHIHAIRNPLDTPLLVLHAYGGDLFATPRSNWDPEAHEEIPYDWEKVRSK
ncbi:MAG: hypothetical protein WB783_07195 [Arenicellales bacterium]